MSVSPTLAVPQTVLTAFSCPMTTNVSASLALQVEGAKADSVCVNLSLVRMEEPALYLAALQWDTLALVNLVILALIVREACPVESCLATMEEAVHLLHGEPVALAYQVMVGPNVSTELMMGAPLSPAGMEGFAQKRQAFPSSTVSVLVDGKANVVNRSVHLLNHSHLHALWLTVMVKPMMVFATRNATHLPVSGMVGTAL